MTSINTLRDLLGGFRDHADRRAIMFARDGIFQSWTFLALADHAQRLAIGLLGSGLSRQESVAILAPNRPEWIASYFGIVAAGATAVPIDFLASDDDVILMLTRSGCQRIFTVSERLRRLQARWGRSTARFYSLDETDSVGSGGVVVTWRSLQAEGSARLPEVRPDDRASLLFTSGTTGEPKAVPLTHANFVANVRALLEERIVGSDDRILLPLPLHHTYPFTVGMLGTLASGATLILPAGMTGPQILGAANDTRVTVIIGVPGLYQSMLSAIDSRIAQKGKRSARAYNVLLALSTWLRRRFGLHLGRTLFHSLHAKFGGSLRVLASGGAKLDPEVAWRLEGLGWRVLSGYGLTETSPMLTFNPPDRARIDTEGVSVPGVELRFVPVSGETYGEIQARGPNVFAGYLDSPTANEAAFAEDGWFRTGDLGFIDEAGYLHVVGRANETIVLPDGKKLFPDNVEAVFKDIPFIKELAVLLYERGLVALIVLEPEAIRSRGAARVEALLREEIEHCSARLKPHERVTGYVLTNEALPRTHLGKLKRHRLPTIYQRAKSGIRPAPSRAVSEVDRALLETSGGQAIWEWLVARFADYQLSLDTSPQLDLGIDSLKWIDLTIEIQDRFHVSLTEAEIAQVMALRDLLQTIINAQNKAPKARSGIADLADEQIRRLASPGVGYRILGLILYGVNKFLMRVLFRLAVHGLSRIPEVGCLVITPNHASNLDPLALAAAFSRRELRRTYWAGWTGILFAGPIMRMISRASQVLPVDPDRDPGAALVLGAAVLRQGHRLVWFPEGRRSPTGEITPFLPGIGHLVRGAGATVIPVRIGGTFEAWPRTRWMPRFSRVSIVFGEPIAADVLLQRGSATDLNARVADALHDAVMALPET